ncbi:transcriptional regulator, LacI family [Izhakiella capsodis]|uniref:Transcriptional regulator, LacI family n=1 Tax=Izhakiella capsodis TaxID=1367852 RepID=A0A1I4Z2G3_9GAMM|nr:trehalose operon repressor TreR [Izhakiella capsodis]SFN44090.1 transcriptional regulator, LacI family [Izhakiella capsodis]
MKNSLTIKDIARLSGVGKSTVSRVLNNQQNVRPDTRERVLKVIEEHNFSPSKSARAMRGFSDKVIAIVVSRLDSPSENQAVRAMLPVFYQQGYDAIVLESQFSVARVKEHLQVLKQRNIDGVILFGFTGLPAKMLLPWRNKLVVLAREIPGLSSVCYDDVGAVRLLMQTLMDRQINDIGFIGVFPRDTTTGLKRTRAYEEYCQQHGLVPHIALGELSWQSGYDLLPQILAHDIRSVICASDTIALGAQKYLQQQQINNVLVCSIGNLPLLRFLFPESFSVELGYGSAGDAAAHQLLALLNGSIDMQQILIQGKRVP